MSRARVGAHEVVLIIGLFWMLMAFALPKFVHFKRNSLNGQVKAWAQQLMVASLLPHDSPDPKSHIENCFDLQHLTTLPVQWTQSTNTSIPENGLALDNAPSLPSHPHIQQCLLRNHQGTQIPFSIWTS